jgi:hypothetical protein
MKPLRVSLDFLEFPRLHTCDGENLSPVILPEGRSAASVTIMVFNPFEKSPVRSHQGSAGPSRRCQSSLPASPARVSPPRPSLRYRE